MEIERHRCRIQVIDVAKRYGRGTGTGVIGVPSARLTSCCHWLSPPLPSENIQIRAQASREPVHIRYMPPSRCFASLHTLAVLHASCKGSWVPQYMEKGHRPFKGPALKGRGYTDVQHIESIGRLLISTVRVHKHGMAGLTAVLQCTYCKVPLAYFQKERSYLAGCPQCYPATPQTRTSTVHHTT